MVGFIQKLPHALISAFHATLEEAAEADLLLHVVDASNLNYEEQIEAVMEVLRELGAADKPMLYVFNKADALDKDTMEQECLPILHGREGVILSTRTGTNLKELQKEIVHFFRAKDIEVTLLLPYHEGALLSKLHEEKRILKEVYQEAGVYLRMRIPRDMLAQYF